MKEKPASLVPYASVSGPDVRPIRAIHRADDGYIAFARITEDGEWQEWYHQGEYLESMFPQFRNDLLVDSYFSINSYWNPKRGNDNVRWLNACFVDVDCADADDLGARLGRVLAMAHKGELPKPSYVVFSGRGFWLLWLLSHNGSPAQGIWHHRILYDRIERELVARCQADPKAKDIARVMRVPGSQNSKAAGAYVRFERYVGQDVDGHTYEYALEALANMLGVAAPEFRPGKTSKGLTGRRSTNPRGHVQVWNLRYEAFNQLRQLRGGAFREGCRYNACLLLAITLWRMGLAKPDVERDVRALAKQCQPPLSEAETRNALKAAFKSKATKTRFREDVILQWLNVTPEERTKIFRWRQTDNPPIRPCSRSERRAAITNLVKKLGFRPPLRLMRRELRALGIGACDRRQLNLPADDN